MSPRKRWCRHPPPPPPPPPTHRHTTGMDCIYRSMTTRPSRTREWRVSWHCLFSWHCLCPRKSVDVDPRPSPPPPPPPSDTRILQSLLWHGNDGFPEQTPRHGVPVVDGPVPRLLTLILLPQFPDQLPQPPQSLLDGGPRRDVAVPLTPDLADGWAAADARFPAFRCGRRAEETEGREGGSAYLQVWKTGRGGAREKRGRRVAPRWLNRRRLSVRFRQSQQGGIGNVRQEVVVAPRRAAREVTTRAQGRQRSEATGRRRVLTVASLRGIIVVTAERGR